MASLDADFSDDASLFSHCPPCDFDTDDELMDQIFNTCLLCESCNAFPIDVSKVARAQPGDAPTPGKDTRAPKMGKDTPCPGCKHSRARDDWEHNRVIGQCWYPYDEPWIPECPGCQARKPRHDASHTYRLDECRYAVAKSRKQHKRGQVHDISG